MGCCQTKETKERGDDRRLTHMTCLRSLLVSVPFAPLAPLSSLPLPGIVSPSPSFLSSYPSAPRYLTLDVPADANRAISENKVMVFSKTYCPYCTKVKQALSEAKVDYRLIEMDTGNGEKSRAPGASG